MIACILAGGEGTRLRPVSCNQPKPMTFFLTRPVLGHMLARLRACGVERACVTLRHMPERIRAYFGDGADWGVALSWYEEAQPLGTAGGAAACDFPEGEEVLVISGDAVCDFDFREALAFHRSRGAQATLLLSHQAQPLEYGVVECGEDGRVVRFAEKPAWQRVRSDTVNTGIYILSPEVLAGVEKGKPADFSRDVFPSLLARGAAVYGYAPQGYWCDIGDCGAYLSCVHDALAGKIGIDLPAFPGGVCSFSEIPEDVQICPPVYVGRGVRIGADARIGPFTALGDGVNVGRGTVIEGSVVLGSTGENASLFEAVTGAGSFVGDGAVLASGTVLGDNARVGARTVLRPGVRVWPDCDTGEDTVVRFSMQCAGQKRRLRFSPRAELRGACGVLSPELGAGLGSALASAGEGTIGLSCDGSAAAQTFLCALASGVRACGEDALLLDPAFAALAAYALPRAGCALTAHVQRQDDGALCVRILAGDGLPAEESVCRKLENLLALGDYRRADTREAGALARMTGARERYLRACLAWGRLSPRAFGVCGGEAGRALGDALFLMGAHVGPDAPLLFSPSPDGTALEARDEEGNRLDDAHTLACAFYASCAQQAQEAAACPEDAPQALDGIARHFGKTALRCGAQARDALARAPYLYDGVLRGAYLAAYLAKTGQTLAGLRAGLPPFAGHTAEIPLRAGRAAFMRAAAQAGLGGQAESVRYAPDHLSEKLRVYAESSTAEAAKALCESVCEQARRLDTDLKRQKVRMR